MKSPESSRFGAQHSLRERLAARSGTRPEDWYPVYKARYGMALVFRALRAKEATTVVTQLFTCCTAVDPVLVAGLTPRYGEISAETLALDPEVLAVEGSDAVVLQHTFGIVDADRCAEVARRTRAAGALLVEDSAHCVTRMARDAQGEPLADVSIHSFGVEKMLPTHFGGAVWVNPSLARTRPRLDRVLRRALEGLEPIGRRLDAATRVYAAQNRVLARVPGAAGRLLRGALTRTGLHEPAISARELAGGLQGPPTGPSEWVSARAVAALDGLDANEERRSANVAALRRALVGARGVTVPAAVCAGPAQPLLRFPVILPSTTAAEEVIAAARAVGAYAQAWYRPLLYPGVTDPEGFGVPEAQDLPVTHEVSARIACLPTDLDGAATARMVRAVLDACRA